MNSHDDMFYKIRKATDEHNSYIRNEKKLQKDDEEFCDLVDTIFGHQVAVYGKYSCPDKITLPVSRELAAYLFYTRYYIEINVKSDIAGAQLDVNDFINKVILTKANNNRNNIYFLLGEVGCGKTAFLNYLITKYCRKWFNTSEKIVIRIDVDISGNGQMITSEEMIREIIRKTVRVIRTNPKLKPNGSAYDMFEKLAQNSNCEIEKAKLNFSKFAKEYKRNNKLEFVLFIDNIDYIYHVNDRILFDSDNDTKETCSVKSVCSLVNEFFYGTLGKMEANILLVMRPDSYNILQETKKIFPSVPSLSSNNKNVLTIEAPNWDDVIIERGKFLECIINRIDREGKSTLFKNVVNPILRDLEHEPTGERPLIEHLRNLTNFGLRDMMRFFAQYSWLERHDEGDMSKGLDRFINQYPVGLFAYMLNGRKRFNQFNSEFPNIYLVNVIESDKNSNGNGNLFRHYTTYWLKRLLMHFIYQRELNEERVALHNIIDIFTDSKPGAYEEVLVRKCLGSLAQANYSNMIKVTREKSSVSNTLRVQDIILTPRGKHCLTQIVDRFYYMQLIVDDYMLPIPRVVDTKFRYSDEDYGYIILPPNLYSKSAKEMINKKAEQVLYFAECLDITFQQEKATYEKVFKMLERNNVSLPNTANIKRKLAEEIKRITSHGRGFVDVDGIVRKIENDRGKLEEFFNDAYDR
ncbi:hypothetical protein DSLASN_05560 [Desulfoluna limicola]|uniref:AAA+ ATPase domain-containing protein n=1 Tax=Desulfoluna limicola TaxID=2810562 RepID=A0ABN6EX28_9BACT|nr:hypothetical protein [Desulfoluna limicola]BCS94924.1 hypothetical protein DSLASN_05560 [Desulfoluna limicola]